MQHNHFYLINNHVTCHHSLTDPDVYPIVFWGDDFDYATWGDNGRLQKAFGEVNEAEKSGKAIIEGSKWLHSDCLNLIANLVSKNLNTIGLAPQINSICELLAHIPFFIVTNSITNNKNKHKTASNGQITGEYPIPTHFVCSDIPLIELERMVGGNNICRQKDENVEENETGLFDKEEKTIYDKLPYPIVCSTPLGLYQRDGDLISAKDSSDYSELLTKRRIFLWIDNIQKTANYYHCSYESLFFQVLCHEFMHALMDVYSGECLNIEGANGSEKEIYYEYREESLANGLSLYLLKDSSYKDQYENVVNFVRTQPLQYKLGLAYVTPKKFESALVEWMEQKMGKKLISRDDLYDWMRTAVETLKVIGD